MNNQPSEKWKEFAFAGRRIREHFDLDKALQYLIGEKLLWFMDEAKDYEPYVNQIPLLPAEIREIFSAEEIELYLSQLQRRRVIAKPPTQPGEFARRKFTRAELDDLLL